jgi:hypothetical protein
MSLTIPKDFGLVIATAGSTSNDFLNTDTGTETD